MSAAGSWDGGVRAGTGPSLGVMTDVAAYRRWGVDGLVVVVTALIGLLMARLRVVSSPGGRRSPRGSPHNHRATVVVARRGPGITAPRHVLRSRQSGTRMAFPLSRSNLTGETRRATRPNETEVL